jgi:transcriptional regulator with XRE-family HTH domain
MSVGDRIREEREFRGWTQQELADKTGFSKSSIANWETGRRSPQQKFIEKIAKAMNISPKDLTDEDFEREIKAPTLYELMADGILQPVKDQHRLAFDEFLKTNPDIELWFRQIQKEKATEEELERLKTIIIEWIKKGAKDEN